MSLRRKISKIIIFTAVCLSFIAVSQSVFGLSRDELPKDAVVIGFIDSGIAPYNLDGSHILAGKNYVFENGDTEDRIGHGTKTAGMVLGSADGTVPGVFPEAYVVPLVVVDKYPSGVTSNGGNDALIAAIMDAVDVFKCDVINISLCTSENSSDLKAAIDHANDNNVIIVCSSGNTPDSKQTFYPANYEGVITIGSSDSGEIASFTTKQDTDFYYEGSSVRLVNNKQGKVSTVDSGTSFSCAAVSGICAYWRSQDPELTQKDVYSLLAEHCIPGSDCIIEPFCEEEYELETVKSAHVICQDINGIWCQPMVEFAIENDLVAPLDDINFKPSDNATRAVVVNALYQLSGAPEVSSGKTFHDVSSSDWYNSAVTWAADCGIVSGYTSGNFGPEDSVTREQLCTIFCKYAAFEGIELTFTAECLDFTDKNSIAPYAVEFVGICQKAGIVSGKPGGFFDPKGTATRGQFCSMLMNFVR